MLCNYLRNAGCEIPGSLIQAKSFKGHISEPGAID